MDDVSDDPESDPEFTIVWSTRRMLERCQNDFQNDNTYKETTKERNN